MRTNDFYLVAAAASMMMFAACTHDDGTLSTTSPASNEIVITTRSSDIGFTRAESDIQSDAFKSNELIHIFLRDAADPASVSDTTHYDGVFTYKSNGSNGGTLTRDGSTEVKVYWPKLMHPLHIYGIYPKGSVGWSAKKTASNDATAYTNNRSAFDKTFKYYFTVAADQTNEADYKASDLMTGFPTGYTHTAGVSFSAPFTLTQNETPGIIPLTFTHRLTKITVNITITNGTNDITMDQIRYDETATNPTDTKYAVVTLENVARKTWFCVDNTDAVAADRVNVDGNDSGGGVDAQPGTTVIVGKGKTAMSGNTESVTLSAIVPPQTITGSEVAPKHFIKVDLYDLSIDPTNPVNTFYYDLKADLTLQASKVHTYNIRINKPNISVSTSITNWTAVGAVDNIGVLQ